MAATVDPFSEISAFLIHEVYPSLSLERVEEVKKLAASIPILTPTPEKYTMDRVQMMNRGYEQWATILDLRRKKTLSDAEIMVMRGFANEIQSISLHYDVTVRSLELFSNKEQHEKWVPLANDLQIIGCYAQTELACGSDVQNLQTTATFDESTQEFVIQTPNPGALKWWIGVLSMSCTHAIVFARLITKGKDYGPHPFFVQVRDMTTHNPVPGVKIGDIGPKFGFWAMDNGYMAFDKFRVPRISLLARFSAVSASGDYEFLNPDAPKLLYVAMLSTRTFLSKLAWHQLAKGVTIAIKYSHFRTQFKTVTQNPGNERLLIDYQMQQRKLIPLLAKTYAVLLGGQALYRMFETLVKQLEQDDASLLDEVHVLACACKSFYTWTTAEGLETCRQSCGGHGFSAYSALPWMYANYLPACTYEGDNSLLTFQVARFLVKCLHKAKNNQQISPRFAFLSQPRGQISTLPPETVAFQLICIRGIVQHYAQVLFAKEEAAIAKKMKKKEVWNKLLEIQSVPAARAVCWLFTLEEFSSALSRLSSPQAVAALDTLRQVFGLSEIYENRSILLRIGVLNPVQVEAVSLVLEAKIKEAKAVSLKFVDAFGFQEVELNSALVSEEGHVYEKLMKWVKEWNVLGAKEPFPGVLKHLKPLAKL